MLMFIDSRQPSEDGKLPLLESTLHQARTCGPTILLPTASYRDYTHFKDENLAGLIGHNDKIYILLKLIQYVC